MPDDDLKPVLTELAKGMTALAQSVSALNSEERRDIWTEISKMRDQVTNNKDMMMQQYGFIEKQLVAIQGDLKNHMRPCELVVALTKKEEKRNSFFWGLVKSGAACCVVGLITFTCFLVWHWLQTGAPKP